MVCFQVKTNRRKADKEMYLDVPFRNDTQVVPYVIFEFGVCQYTKLSMQTTVALVVFILGIHDGFIGAFDGAKQKMRGHHNHAFLKLVYKSVNLYESVISESLK